MRRQGAQVAIGGKPRRVDTDFGRVDRRPGPIGRTTEDTRDLVWPFLRLERAGAVDEGAARLDELRRVIEQPRLDLGETAEGGGRILHPPRTLCETGQVLDPSFSGNAYRAGRQQPSGEPLGPRRGIAFGSDIERRLAQGALADRTGQVLAVSLGPPRPEPIRNVGAHLVLGRRDALTLFAHAPQDGVD